ncbi:uncharacterized protein OCT59_005561 [Rhizophagus irregularis]|uniref:Uncharacterized protein n=1 Tax=Rhizophagus irregularis TaxID=588596 RepID=A0A915YU35_9GLOM|nr:hypothetical protein OCT59_005561 [Rhizophagus irregularis]GBC37835.1 hypothetical protein RIR_jg18907.t1 [Rhizophagus irregularis DAOM 181602=DAOM 197198]CAB5334256.1 unnamed protein product [Rhizophagus irregularis]
MSSHLEYTSNIRALRPHHAIPTLRIKFQNILPLFKIPYSYNNNNNTISNITPESLPNFSLYFPNLLLTITRPPFT